MEAHDLFKFDIGFFFANVNNFDIATIVFGPLFQNFYEFLFVAFYGCAYIWYRLKKNQIKNLFLVISEFWKEKD